MRPRTVAGAALLLSAGGFFGSWAAASASSLQVDGGVLQTWSFPVALAVQPAPAQIAQGHLATAPTPTVDETVTPEGAAAPPAEEVAPAAEPTDDVASTAAPPPTPASEPQP